MTESAFIPTESGYWVSEHYERLARVVQDYDPIFELFWIPPDQRETPEERKNCYAVVEHSQRGDVVVFHASEMDTPESILERLFLSDNKHGNVLDRIDAHNNAIRALEMKSKMDEAEERMDKVAWLVATKKNFIEMGNGRVLDDQLRVVREGKRDA
jgi:hypothetical protein